MKTLIIVLALGMLQSCATYMQASRMVAGLEGAQKPKMFYTMDYQNALKDTECYGGTKLIETGKHVDLKVGNCYILKGYDFKNPSKVQGNFLYTNSNGTFNFLGKEGSWKNGGVWKLSKIMENTETIEKNGTIEDKIQTHYFLFVEVE